LENGGLSYILNTEAGQIPISLRLTGFFNVYNSLGAAALCFSQGVSLENIRDGLEAVIGVPGRFERIENDRGLNIVVDYAHTPGGLENVLQSGRELTPKGRLILVFGAGGDRDRSKRPLMGAVAGRLADLAIITSDNPRSEEPGEICSSIEKGLLKENHQSSYKIIVDRRTAIRRAVELANPDDLVIVAGKGHETYQELAQGRIHFDRLSPGLNRRYKTMAANRNARRKQLQNLLAEDPFLTDQQLAELLEVSVATIRLDRMALSIPELRERTKTIASKNYSKLKALEGTEVIGEIIDLELG